MTRLDMNTLKNINTALFFAGSAERPARELRPWQYVMSEYDRVGLTPPADLPDFESVEEAQIWMCLDTGYNRRIREAV